MAKATLEQQFWSKVRKTETCWLWMAGITSSGYGCAWIGKRPILAHRLAYELLVGTIPQGLTLDHLCRVRACVNPAHLEPVTNRENVLRGEGATAQHARQTHCKRGHPFDELNTYQQRQGGRGCRACRRLRERGYREARR